MPAGIRIFNDAGTVQIDDNYQNFFLVKSGTLTTNDVGMADLSVDYNGPIILATSNTEGSCAALRGRTGTAWQYKVGSRLFNQEVKWYAFADPEHPEFNGGLRVFDEDGNITYDSNQKPLVVSYFFSIPTPILPDYSGRPTERLPTWDQVQKPQDIYVPLRAGRTYTAFPINFDGAVSIAYKVKFKGGWRLEYAHYCYIPAISTGGVTFKPSLESGGGRYPSNPEFYEPRGKLSWYSQQYWVIDITGY